MRQALAISLVGWRKHESKGGPLSELDMLGVHCCYNAEEEIQRLMETGLLRVISHLGPTHPHWEGPEDIPFTNTVQNFRGKQQHPWRALYILCRPDLTVREAVTEQRNLNAMGITGSWGIVVQMAAFNCQRQGRHDYHKGHQSQSSNQKSLTHADLWCWLFDYGVPGMK